MELLNRLRRQVFAARLPGILLALLPALVLGAALLPSAGQLLGGPRDLYALSPQELEGSYAAAHIDTVWDWYAQTVATGTDGRQSTVSRQYLVPLADGRTFIGVKVTAEQVAAGDRVMEETARWRSNPGAYLWDGSELWVCGSIRPMDDQTRTLYYDFLREGYGLEEEDLEHFLPLVLVQGEVGGVKASLLPLLGLTELLLLAAAVIQALAAGRAAGNLQIARYCGTRPFPEQEWETLDRLRGLTGCLYGLSAENGWVVCLDGARSWALEAGDVAWVYLCRNSRPRRGSRCRVLVYSRSEPPARRRHEIPADSEEDAREIIRDLMPELPDTVFGYSPDREREYRRDPEHFGRRTEQAAAGSAPCP